MLMRLVVIAAAFTATPSLAQVPETPPPPPIVVHGPSPRAEIQRILNADNVDTTNLEARVVADGMALIERGRAPDDFWTAYQTHVDAWRKLADAEDLAQSAAAEGRTAQMGEVAALVAEAEAQIEATFSAVERIALDYGARMPIPADELAHTA